MATIEIWYVSRKHYGEWDLCLHLLRFSFLGIMLTEENLELRFVV